MRSILSWNGNTSHRCLHWALPLSFSSGVGWSAEQRIENRSLYNTSIFNVLAFLLRLALMVSLTMTSEVDSLVSVSFVGGHCDDVSAWTIF